MLRALTTLAAIAAVAVSVAPVASAGNSTKPPPCGTAGSTLIGEISFPKAAPESFKNCCVGTHYYTYTPKGNDHSKKPPQRGTAGCTRIGEVTFPKARGAAVINSLAQKYTASAPKPPGLGARSGGEVVSSDAFVKAPPRSVKDGSSNTVMSADCEGRAPLGSGRAVRINPTTSEVHMIRALSILAAGAALAVSASPASARVNHQDFNIVHVKAPTSGSYSASKDIGPLLRKAPRGVVVLIGANDYGLLAKAERSNNRFTVDMVSANARDNNPFTLDIA